MEFKSTNFILQHSKQSCIVGIIHDCVVWLSGVFLKFIQNDDIIFTTMQIHCNEIQLNISPLYLNIQVFSLTHCVLLMAYDD